MVSNRDIGFVHEGQEVEIKGETFNFTKYGFIDGKVLSVSHDAIAQEKGQSPSSGSPEPGPGGTAGDPHGQEPAYAARISLDRSQMEIDGHPENLSPGMAVTAEIKTGSQRVIQFLLSPLYKSKQEALHER